MFQLGDIQHLVERTIQMFFQYQNQFLYQEWFHRNLFCRFLSLGQVALWQQVWSGGQKPQASHRNRPV